MKILLYIAAPFLYLFSLLPLKVLYLVSDLINWLLSNFLSYRKKIVVANLRNAFPELSAEEISVLTKKHYRYLLDLIFEILKMFSSPRAWTDKMVDIEGEEVLTKLYAEEKSVILVTGHMGNWELAGSKICNFCQHEVFSVYHPLTNEVLDKWFLNMRSSKGVTMFTMEDTVKAMIRNRRKLTLTGFISDQTPSNLDEHWMTFLNQETLVFRGAGLLAKKLNFPIVFLSTTRPKRGKYIIHAELVCENPQAFSIEELTEMHIKKLEENIIKQPEIWLWTHRRWKRKKPAKSNIITR